MLQKISRILLIISLTLCSFACLYLYVNPHLDDFQTIPFENKTVYVGERFTAETKPEPSNYKSLFVKWSSSNPEVATITENGGWVETLTPGTTTITAKDFINEMERSFELVVLPYEMYSVYISAPYEIIHPEETMQIETSFYPLNSTYTKFDFTSSNPAVATIDDKGLVTGVSEGETTITVTNSMQPEVFETYDIKVQNTIECESISVSLGVASPFELRVDRSYSISIIKTPENADVNSVTYSSSNPGIVEVSDNGIASPIYAGSATITVTTDQGLTGTMNVAVPYVKPSGIRIVCSGSTAGFKYTLLKGSVKHLTAGFFPSNATVSSSDLEWSSSDPSKVSVDANGKITAHETTKTIIGTTTFNLEVAITVRIKGMSINDYTPASLYVTVP